MTDPRNLLVAEAILASASIAELEREIEGYNKQAPETMRSLRYAIENALK